MQGVVAHLRVPGDLSWVGPVRRRVREVCGALLGAPDRCDTLVLLTSELVTNAVMHAGGRVEVAVEVVGTRRLRVEVRDGSRELPRVQDADSDAMGGRGLLLVDKLADAWGVEIAREGKSVWFELRLGP